MTVQQPDGAVRSDLGGVSGEPAAPALPRVAFVATGTAQVAFTLLITTAFGAAAGWGYTWISDVPDPVIGYLRALAWVAAVLVGWELTSIVGKWLLIGRPRPGRITLWSLHYFRFWAASLLVRSSPAARLIGSEWQRWHLNACGGRVGPGTVLLCPTPGVADLLEIGPNSVIGERSLLSGYRPSAGALILDRIQIGAGSAIGDDCVLEPGATVGDHARLAASSSLQPGQQVPSGQSWHGSPARPVEVELPDQPRLLTPPRLSHRTRMVGYAWLQMLAWVGGLAILASAISWLARFLSTEFLPAVADGSASIGLAIATAAAVCLATVALIAALIAAVAISALARLLAAVLEDNRVFPLPGGRWAAARLVRAGANLNWLNEMFGGSALAWRQLRLLGWRLLRRPGSFEAWGEHFGQSDPLAITWGAGSMAGDRLWIANVEYSSDAFRLSPARIGADCSIGEQVTWPGAAQVGDRCRIAPRTAIPLSGGIRIDASLIGSPAIETERQQSERRATRRSMPEHDRQLADRVRHDLGTIVLQLLVSLLWLTIVLTGIQGLAVTNWPSWLIASAMIVGAALIRWSCWLAAEGLARSVNPPRPIAFSILDLRFSRHHRVRRLGPEPPRILLGTPLRPLWWRLRGAEMGRCVFDDGAQLSEPSLVTIGDQVCLGQGAVLQSHQTKDSAYALAPVFVGDRTVLGNRSLLLGGTQLGIDAQVAADSVLFAPIGEAGSSWLGNPAVLVEPSLQKTRASSEPGQTPAAGKPAIKQRRSSADIKSSSPATAPTTKSKTSGAAELTGMHVDVPPTATSAPAEPAEAAEAFTLLGTSFMAQRIALPELEAAVATLDLSVTPLLELNLPQALAGFGIPEECLEDDLSLRDAAVPASAEIRSLLARVLLRQLLSQAHPSHQPHEWGFIRSSTGGLKLFWPTTDDSVSLGRSASVVVAAIASGPVGVAALPESDDPNLDPAAAAWLSLAEEMWLARQPRTEAGTNVTRMAALKNAALKAVSELGSAEAAELDTVTEPNLVLWRPQSGPQMRLRSTIRPIVAGGVQHWIAVVRPIDSPQADDEALGVIHNDQH